MNSKRGNTNLKLLITKDQIEDVGDSLVDYLNLIKDYVEYDKRSVENIVLNIKVFYTERDNLGLTTDFWVEVAQGKYK